MDFYSVETRDVSFPGFGLLLSGIAYEGAEIIRGKIVELMKEPKTGNPYKHRDGTVREASAEGEAPGINSEDLVGSFDVIELSMTEAQINTDIFYGNILQEKRERLFTDPAVELAMPEIVEKIEDRIEQEWR